MAQAMSVDMRSLRLDPSPRRLDSIHHFLPPPTAIATVLTATSSQQLSSLALHPPRSCVHSTSTKFSIPVISTDSYAEAGEAINDGRAGASKKNQNVKKRKAPRAVRWAMKLASFSAYQIERIIRAASLKQEVFDALELLKRMEPDDREGKRSQLKYIGKLLRDAEPDLLDGLIQATKDGNRSMIETLSARGHEDKIMSESDRKDGGMVPLTANGAVKEQVSTAKPWNEVPPNSFRRKGNSLYRGGFSLGVDLGLSRTGLAISKGFSIRPLKVLGLRGQKLERVLMNIAAEREVDEFIIGLPTSYDGKETPQSNKVRSVAGRIAALAAERGWRVYLQEEYGTSLDAMQIMIDRGLSKSSREGNLDSYAAMVVLERYFSTSGKDTELVWPKKLELQEKLRSTAKATSHDQLEDFD